MRILTTYYAHCKVTCIVHIRPHRGFVAVSEPVVPRLVHERHDQPASDRGGAGSNRRNPATSAPCE